MKDDFFIGYLEQAPESYARKSKFFAILAMIIAVLVAAVFVLSQKGFEDSNFEFGNITNHEGILVETPVPMLKVQNNGKTESILLVGFGKFGAESALADMKAKAGKPIFGKSVKIKGSLIYHDNKKILELTENGDAFVGFSNKNQTASAKKISHGNVSLFGEIYDPKCAFGVMKPGYGKPHRSCAIRCISSGIPPVLKMTNKDGASNYCILKGENNEVINAEVLDFVADQIRICGRLEQEDDWLVLYTNPSEDILRLQPHFIEGKIPMCNM